MPREVRAFACQFGCGRQVQMSRLSVDKHEQTCASNPARKACRTCRYDWHDGWDSCCERDARGDKTMVFKCDQWEAER